MEQHNDYIRVLANSQGHINLLQTGCKLQKKKMGLSLMISKNHFATAAFKI